MTRFSRPPGGLRRLVAVFSIGAVTLGLVSVGTASAAETTEPGDTSEVGDVGATLRATSAHPSDPFPLDWLCQNLPDDHRPFDDTAGNTFELDIDCLHYGGIARGVGGGTSYWPAASITREQMASLMARMMDTAKELERGEGEVVELPAFDGVHHFVDTNPANTHTANVNRLRAAGIAMGGPDGLPADQFGPGRTVTRGQMATFISRALSHMMGETLVAAKDHFTDDAGSTHEPNINVVAEAGIAVGRRGSTEFGFSQTLPRDQMAAFIARTLALLEFTYSVGEDEYPGWIFPLPAR